MSNWGLLRLLAALSIVTFAGVAPIGNDAEATVSSKATVASDVRAPVSQGLKGRVSQSKPSLLQGAYTGPKDLAGIAAFGAATKSNLTIAYDYLPDNGGWSAMDGSNGSLNWFTGAWSQTKYRLSIGVPMIPTNSAKVPVGTLAVGATGAYNQYYVTLADTLIAAGEGNAFLRLGWEFDGNWYPWSASNPIDETNYVTYFQQIVTAMRTVSGEAFQFVWNPDAVAFTAPGYSVATAYPGSQYVNVIGLDAYDQSWTTPLTPSNVWNNTILPALTAAENFASSKNEPLAICEWGTITLANGHGLGDDPLYINNMMDWMKNSANHVEYESYFNRSNIPYGGSANALLTGGQFSSSLAALIAQEGSLTVKTRRIQGVTGLLLG
jgi:hypothetical protein